MNVSPVDTCGTSHDVPPSPDPDGLAAPWLATDESGEASTLELAAAEASWANAHDAGKDGPPGDEAQLVQWISAVVDQDERALAALYDATFAHVMGIVRRIVRRQVVAEEVVEDTYFQVWRQAARFDPVRGQALTWLLSIARSRAIDALRRETRFQHEVLDEEDARGTPDTARPSDELLDLARNQADLHQALMLLGAQPRQLVSLAFFRGLSHEEIAQQMSLPLGTVKSQIRRALQTLRQLLDAGGCTAHAKQPTLASVR